jgi:hypothetical protein
MSPIQKGKYRHYKGHLYGVTGTARHCETLEDMGLVQQDHVYYLGTADYLKNLKALLQKIKRQILA